MNLANIIESILFVHGEPIKIARLTKILDKNEDDIMRGLDELERSLAGRGIALLRKENEVVLATAPEAAKFMEEMVKEEFGGELTKAALETLAIAVYHGPISKIDIDFIRGVNSSFTLRSLMVRGLVEREVDPKDKRTFIYKPSMRFLQFLGISKLEDLPEYAEFKSGVDKFLSENK